MGIVSFLRYFLFHCRCCFLYKLGRPCVQAKTMELSRNKAVKQIFPGFFQAMALGVAKSTEALLPFHCLSYH